MALSLVQRTAGERMLSVSACVFDSFSASLKTKALLYTREFEQVLGVCTSRGTGEVGLQE